MDRYRSDNSCEINLMDCYDRKDIRADQINKGETKEQDTVSGKYIGKNRRAATKIFEKKVAG